MILSNQNLSLQSKSNSNLKQDGPISFISLSETVNHAEAEAIKVLDQTEIEAKIKENLISELTSSKKKRYTEDGRVCARAFMQEGKTYTDCTSSRSPDGQMKQKEWCYVDPNMKGNKVWDYCKATMDYDKVREANQNYLIDVTTESRKIESDVDSRIPPTQKAIDEIKMVKEGQAKLDNKINLMLKDLWTVKNNLANLYSTKTLWEEEEKNVVIINHKIKKAEEKQKEDKNTVVEYFDTSEDTIRDEISKSRAVISPVFQRRKKETEKNCNGQLLYEEEPHGDGLRGQYYDNESWLGSFKERKDDEINFNWTGASPLEGINPNNYSIKWQGFFLAPYTANYIFAIECDDGASLTLNNEIIISHNMHTASIDSVERTDRWLNNEVTKKKNPNIVTTKSTSKHVHLAGGNKYKIVVSYFHSCHDTIQEDSESFIRFTVKSDDFKETIIPRSLLYTSNGFAPLKVSDFNAEDAVVRKLYNNDLAFKNSEVYLIQDIPSELLGSTTLRLNSRIKGGNLSFTINTPAFVYIAYIAHYPNPLPAEFEDTFMNMSILEIEKNINRNNKKILAKASGLLNVYKKSYPAGKVSIKLSGNGPYVKGVPLIVFFGFDSGASSPVSCGGEETNVSDTNGKLFKQCTASSEYNNDWKCSNAFNKKLKDGDNGMWATRAEGQGAWIKISFKQLVQVSRFEFKDRRNPAERNSKIDLLFDDGEMQSFSLKSSDELRSFTIKPVKTSSIKIIIKTVFGTINNGGSFNFYGNVCINTEITNSQESSLLTGLEKVTGVGHINIEPIYKNGKPKEIKLHCKDSVSNSRKFDSIKKGYNERVLIHCIESCSPAEVNVYGDMLYSKDSSICRSAFHSQNLPLEGGNVWLVFKTGKNSYKSNFRNGIKSLAKGKSDLTISFEVYKELDDIILQIGSRIDIINPVSVGWLPAVITNIVDKDDFYKVITINIEGDNGKSKEITYPDKNKIQPCGEYVKNRDCSNSRRNLNTKKPIKIRFVPKDFNEQGEYLKDHGYTYGNQGKPFGWSKDISNRVRSYPNGNSKDQITLVEFPPSPKSKYCDNPSDDTLCENLTWTLKTGNGKYFIRLSVGDPSSDSVNNIMINGKYAVRNQIVKRNHIKVYETEAEAVNEFITLSAECEENCDYAVTKLVAIEIMPFKLGLETVEAKNNEIKTCGDAFTGGRCETGPDILHCIINNPENQVAQNCNGSLMLMQIQPGYKCGDQIGKYKCIKKSYSSSEECKQNCVQQCRATNCVY